MALEILSRESIKEEDLHLLYKESSPWFQHTLEWIEYTLAMRESGSYDLSFAVAENKKIVAFIPLVKEYIYDSQNKNEFFMAGFPTVYPLFSNNLSKNNKDKIEKLIFERLFNMAESEDISYINMYVSPLSDLILNKDITVNPMCKFSFHDTTISTNILDLKEESEVLFRNFRKGTKSDVKTAIKSGFEIEIFDKNNITRDIFNIYKDLHFQAAGRKTRPDKTWDLMFEWIQNDFSVLALTSKDDIYVSAQFVNTYEKKAYYQSGATLPEFSTTRGIGHLAQWKIIEYLKLQAFKYYELGWNWYPNLSQEVADSKMLGISRFKAGFGADIYPLFRAEWFRDKEYMKEIYKNRFQNFNVI